MFLVGSKCDLEHERKVSTKQGETLADKYGMGFIETSAKDVDSNVAEIFNKLTREVMERVGK